MSDVRVAIIGCGRISGHHCRSIAKVPGVELVAVCDLIADKAHQYSKTFDVPAYTNYREMFERVPDINTVAINTPSGMHFEHALDVIENYRKHVVVEKPTFLRRSHLNQVYDRASALGLQVFPVFQNRYNKAVQRVRAALHDGTLGAPRIVAIRVRWCRPQRYYDMSNWRGTFAQDGGALTNQGVHHVDLLRYLGGTVATVNATMRTLAVSVEVEDVAIGTMTYESGAVGVVEVTTAARPDDYEASISLVCENGLAQIGGIAVNELQVFSPNPSDCQNASEDFPDVYGFGHLEIYSKIRGALLGRTQYPIERNDALGTLELLHAFYRSDETAATVSVQGCAESTRLGATDEKLASLYRTPPTVVQR